jgi:F-type H+-transporting ATPase subunit b
MFLLAFAEGGPAVQLLPDGTMLIHVALILLMIYILNRTFFRPVNRIIQARVKNKGGRFTEAEEILNQVSEKQAQYNAAILGARNEGYQLIESERAAAITEREKSLNQVKEEVAAALAREKEELSRKPAEARAAIARDADEMANKISANILNAA